MTPVTLTVVPECNVPCTLPLVIFPVTANDPNVPTVVKLEIVTLELIVLPVNALAATPDAVTPVNWLPLPKM